MKTLLVVISILSLFGCSSKPKAGDGRKPSSTGQHQVRFSFAEMFELIRGQGLTSVEATLEKLSEKHRDYLVFHTLMYNSFSLQEGTFEEPRALVFGPEARFIFSFNGNHQMRGGGAFETVEYSDQERSFQFREIAFKKYPGFRIRDLELGEGEIAYQDENIVVSKANPAKCLRCHGANASPIWQTYFMWPGAYGSNDDQLFMSFDKSTWNPNNEGFFLKTKAPSSLGRDMNFKKGKPDLELQGLIRYSDRKAQHARYKWLPARPYEKTLKEYVSGVPFEKLDNAEEAKAEAERYGLGYGWPSRPNDFLLSALKKLNSNRLMARLERERLAGAFATVNWASLFDLKAPLGAKEVVPVMATRIHSLFEKVPFKGVKPTVQEVEKILRRELADEIGMQRERIYRQDANLGKGVLISQPYISDTGKIRPRAKARSGVELIADANAFYADLLQIKRLNELDRIAIQIETDNVVLNTAVGILLKDRGVDLHDYTLNLRQSGLTFHTGGIVEALIYLGVLSRR